MGVLFLFLYEMIHLYEFMPNAERALQVHASVFFNGSNAKEEASLSFSSGLT